MGAHVRKNRESWNATSDEYQDLHGAQLEANQNELAWGVWSLPEHQLRALGEVRGQDVLEFGCGAAQCSIFLQRQGARTVGLDLSERQLQHARRLMAHYGVHLPLVHASAEQVPFADASFDIVFCDHGAMSFANPERTVPEAARILRPGGRFAFNTSSPIRYACWNPETDQVDERLHRKYFSLDAIDDAGQVTFHRTYGDWVRLFRTNGLVIEDLIEPQPPTHAQTSYTGYASVEWAHRWPAECLWVLLRGEGAASSVK